MLNEHFADLVQKSDILELVTEPFLALSVFRLKPSRPITMKESNELNRMFNRRIAGRHDILLTETDLNGVVCIRFAVGSYRTEDKHIHHAFQLLMQEGKIAMDEWQRGQVKAAMLVPLSQKLRFSPRKMLFVALNLFYPFYLRLI